MRTITLTTVICLVLCTQAASQSTKPAASGTAAPLGAYTVAPELPGMGRPVDTAAPASRRRALLRRIGRGAVLISAAHEGGIERDSEQDNAFPQDNTFFYLTPLQTPDAWLVITVHG